MYWIAALIADVAHRMGNGEGFWITFGLYMAMMLTERFAYLFEDRGRPWHEREALANILNSTLTAIVEAFAGGAIFIGIYLLLYEHARLFEIPFLWWGWALAFLLNLNRVAVLLGVYSNLPWIIAPYYAFATMGGAMLTRTRLPLGFRERLFDLFELSFTDSTFWQQMTDLLKPLLWPYTVGSLIGASVIAGLAYPVALAFVRTRRRHRHRSGFGGRPGQDSLGGLCECWQR